MKTKRLKGNILNKILITLILLVLVSTLILTLAYFQDKKEYSGTLNFGEIKLKVSGDSIETGSSNLKFSVDRTGVSYQTGGKIMPGDTVNIKLKVGLEDGSEPAYYVVNISDEKNVFENAFYFSDGTDVYVNDGTKTYKQGDSSKTPVSDKYVGLLEKNTSGHDITISTVVATSVTEQGITTTIKCDVYAIQQANLDVSLAKYMLSLNFRTPLALDKNKKKNVTFVDDYTVTSGYEAVDTYFGAKDYMLATGATYRVSFMATVNSSDSWTYYFSGMGSVKSNLKNGYNEYTFTYTGTPQSLLWDDAGQTLSDPFTITNMMAEIVG